MNSTVGPIFNEKLLKSGICGSINSAWMHCSRLTWSNSVAETKKKKKKKSENANTAAYNSNPNTHLLLKTEKWKYCNKIIFKCVNNVVEPSFKVFFTEKSIYRSYK